MSNLGAVPHTLETISIAYKPSQLLASSSF